MNQSEYDLFKRLTGEKELPPKGSIPRKLLDDYGLDTYAKYLKNEKEHPEDHNGDEDPWHSRD